MSGFLSGSVWVRLIVGNMKSGLNEGRGEMELGDQWTSSAEGALQGDSLAVNPLISLPANVLLLVSFEVFLLVAVLEEGLGSVPAVNCESGLL